MSEVDSHYGSSVQGRRGPAAPRSAEGEWTEQVADTASGAAGRIGRAADTLRDTAGKATDWASDAYDNASRNATYARRRSAAEFNRGRRQVVSFVDQNPVMVGVAGLAAGLLIGALLPGTRRENELVGRYADEAKREGIRYAQVVAEQGRAMLDDNLRGLKAGLAGEDRAKD